MTVVLWKQPASSNGQHTHTNIYIHIQTEPPHCKATPSLNRPRPSATPEQTRLQRHHGNASLAATRRDFSLNCCLNYMLGKVLFGPLCLSQFGHICIHLTCYFIVVSWFDISLFHNALATCFELVKLNKFLLCCIACCCAHYFFFSI